MTSDETSVSSTPGFSKLHVVMSVANDCLNDSRVIKSAETMARAGFGKVSVVCPSSVKAPENSVVNGVNYVRYDEALVDIKSFRFLTFLRGVPATRGVKKKNGGGKNGSSVAAFGFGRIAKTFKVAAKRLLLPVFLALEFVFKRIWGFVRLAGNVVFGRSYFADEWRIDILTGHRFEHDAYQVLSELKPDIIHSHDLATLSCGVAVGDSLGVPVIYDAHELETRRNANYSARVWAAIGEAELGSIGKCAGVITVSESIADHLAKEYDIDRPVVVFNAPKVGTAEPVSGDGMQTVRDVTGVGSEAFLAVYVGKITVNRGLEDCVRALKFLPDRFHLAFVGPRHEPTVAALKDLANEDGTRERLHVVDPVAPDEVVGFIGSADASLILIPNVCLSYYYCMPNKLFESQFAGMPVLVSNLKDLGEYVREHWCGQVLESNEPRDIANAMEALASDTDIKERLAKTRAQLRETVSWAAQEKKLVALYRRILKT